MSNLVVQPVATRRQRKLFLDFPWTLYRGDPNWIPPLRSTEKELVGFARHPFYELNQVQTFIATRSGEVCGRIAAIVNRGHIERFLDRRGFFGFFDCVDDQEVAGALFDAARAWLAERDLHSIRGPANPSMNHTVGMLVDGFDSPPTFMMTYNPTYYPRLVERYGFRKVQDLYAFGGRVEILPRIQAKLAPIAEHIVEHFNVRLRPLDTTRFLEDVEMFLDIYNRSLVGTWGFVPMSAAEITSTARGLRHLMIPELAVAAEIDGRPVGGVFCLPDYNPCIRQIKGRLFPFGFLTLLRNKRKIKRIRVISTNVLPEYQMQGVGLVLLNALVPPAMASGIDEAEFSWVLESNTLSRGSLQKGGAELQKTYRVYDWDPPGKAS